MRGRKPRFNKEMINQAYEYASQGLTQEEIAHNLGISERTFYEWLKKYPQLGEAVKKGKEEAIHKVENALFKRAMGYEYQEIKVHRVIRKDGTVYERQEVMKKHMPPDTTAIIFFLKNRAPDRWADRKETAIELDKLPKLIIELPEEEKTNYDGNADKQLDDS